MSKIIVTSNYNPNSGVRQSKSGYYCIIDDVIYPIDRCTDEGYKTLCLPENDTGRKYVSKRKVNEAGGTLELGEKLPVGEPKAKTQVKDLSEYLDGEDKELYLALVEKATERQTKERELRMAKLAVERAEAKLAELLANKA